MTAAGSVAGDVAAGEVCVAAAGKTAVVAPCFGRTAVGWTGALRSHARPAANNSSTTMKMGSLFLDICNLMPARDVSQGKTAGEIVNYIDFNYF